MPVPNDKAVNLSPVSVYTILAASGNELKTTTVSVRKDATVADVIDVALDNFSIVAGSELFDLCEVFSENGLFPTVPEVLLENARTLNYSECPVVVTQDWPSPIGDNNIENQNVDENGITDKQTSDESNSKHRLYLTHKTGALQNHTDVKVTWLDGLNSNIPPEEWHFEPFYREEGEIDDLVNLPVLDENVLLDELCKRFCRGRIYTYVGGILIAVNPFKYLPIYNPKYVNAYQHRKLNDLPPHAFAIADAAYLRMLQDKQNQCIVISGESGSGKTESTKLILHHLTALSHKTKASVLEKTILAAGPVLEAFGNAKTCHNNNSSRFGKFTQINYRADGVVCGAVLKKYLLEKSRISSQSNNERNYHVFYCLLSGASPAEKESLHLLEAKEYHYLNQTDCYTIEGTDEAYEFTRLKNAIKNIGIHSGIQQRMFAVLSAVLHIGNITFKKRTNYPDEAVSITDDKIVEVIAEILQVEKQELTQPLTMRKTITRGEEFVRLYKKDEAVATRDSMAKCLYASLFDWIVLQTNHIMVNRQGRKSDNKAFSIGVLDIFGFEDFDTNSFEQFCINLANESLQFYLNQHIFKLRQDEYTEEGLAWDHVDYIDNTTCLNLIVGKPTGLILLLDEECSLTMGTDESLLDKFNRHHANNSYYEMPPTREPVFTVIHYAGRVKYQIKDFRAKNRDLMRSDIVMAFKNSRMLFMRELMGGDPIAIHYWSILRHMIKAVAIFKKAGLARSKGEKMFNLRETITWATKMTPPSRRRSLMRQLTDAEREPGTQAMMRRATKVMNRRVHDMTKRIQSPSRVRSDLAVKRTISGGMTEVTRRGGLKSPPTVIAQFQSSLQELMETLNKSHPFFVRCIRSNAQKSPLEFDAELVLRQLRYTGMLETVKIRQAGFPYRFALKAFLKQFKLLFPLHDCTNLQEDLPKAIDKIGLDSNDFQVGITKVFLKENLYHALRKKLQTKIDESAREIQQWIRAKQQRKQFVDLKRSVIVMQKVWRGYLCRKDYQKMLYRHYAAVRIQEFYRSTKSQKVAAEPQFPKFKKAIVKVQSRWRGYSARKKYMKMLKEKHEADEQQEIAENAEHLMNDLLKDTIFTEDNNIDAGGLEGVTPPAPVSIEHKKNIHLYEDIENFEGIFAKQSEPEEKTASVVKLRTHSGAGDLDRGIKKLYRRLSFTAKDKAKSPAIRKSREAEDFGGYEIIDVPADDSSKNSKANSLQFNTPPTKTTGFAGFFSTLHRKGSKRETPKEKKVPRRLSATGDNAYIVNGEIELEVFNSFLIKKVADMNKLEKGKQDTEVDVVFKNALHKYHGNLLFTCADASVQRKESILLKFNDVVEAFQEVLNQMVNQDDKVSKEFSVMGCNLFCGIIEEFQKQKEKLILKRKQNAKPYRRKRRKTVELFEHKGHLYTFQNFNIRTYCEFCNAFIYDRGLLCQACSFTCHKKCHTKYVRPCKGRRPSICGPAALYGTDLSEITSPNNPIPQAIIRLMLEIEKRGLYAVGLYRKPGLQAAVNNLKSVLTSTDADELIFEDERPHTLASCLKLFFRQLPSPVIPNQFYDDFLRSTDLETEPETHTTMYELIQRFPKANRELLERLIVHLSRVAMLEKSNKMSPNGLAIIWAPCLIRPMDDCDPLESLAQLPQQTKCIEVLIDVQLTSRRGILTDIDALHRATSTAEKQLDFIIKERESRGNEETTDGTKRRESGSTDEIIVMLEKEISSMEEERERLTIDLTTMEPHKSRSMDSLDELGSENDFEVITGNYEELTTADASSEKKSGGGYLRLKYAEGHDSSFEDISELDKPTEQSNQPACSKEDLESVTTVEEKKPPEDVTDADGNPRLVFI